MSDLRRNLIRLASTLPKGSGERKALLNHLASTKAAAGETWGRRISEAKRDFLEEVGKEAIRTLRDQGFPRVQSKPQFNRGTLVVQGQDEEGRTLAVTWSWSGDHEIKGTASLFFTGEAGTYTAGEVKVPSMNPMQVAVEFIFKHLQGVVD